MTKTQKAQVWITRIAVGLALFIPLFYIAAPLGYKFDFWGLMTSFNMMGKYGGWLLKIAAGFAAIALLMAFRSSSRKSLLLSLFALAIPLAGMVYSKSLKDGRQGIPPIHDITTNTQDPPVFTSAILKLRGEKSNPVDYVGKTYGKDGELVSVAQVRAYPEVRTIVLSDAPEAAFDKAVSAVNSLGWELQSQSKATGIIEATDTTFWFGFKDDIAIRIRPAEGSGSLVDVRSVSRIGRSDIGANAARITAFSDKISN